VIAGRVLQRYYFNVKVFLRWQTVVKNGWITRSRPRILTNGSASAKFF